MRNIMDLIMNKDFSWRLLTTLCVICAVLSACDAAFAAAPATGDVIGNTLCSLVNNLSGGIAKSIATLAIFAVGIGLFMGKLSWGTAALTAAGVGVIFGAGKLVVWLGGADAGNSNCPTGV
jgi:type IV secretory pathway VirB2 component (pilin)